MARATGISKGVITIAREIPGLIAIDSATLTDANIIPSKAINCAGYESLFVGVEIDVPGTALMTIEALFRDPNAADGSRWRRMFVGARGGFTLAAALAAEDTGPLDGTKMVELRVWNHSQVFFRVSAVANAAGTTGSRILVLPKTPRIFG